MPKSCFAYESTSVIIKLMNVYLDYAATTPMDRAVLAAMMPYFSDDFYNPSSPYAPAVKVRRDYEAAKASMASIIGAKPGEITMTAGATESINLAFNAGTGHVVTTMIEHPAVISSASKYQFTMVDVDGKGRVSPNAIEKAIRPDTWLVSVGIANSEIGTVQPISKIATVVKKIQVSRLKEGNKTPLYLHTDASQGAGQLDLHVARLGVDMMSINAGKVYGPKQVACLYASRNVRVKPLILGGGQEAGLRSGTENVAGMIGMAKAMQLAYDMRDQEVRRLAELRDSLQAQLVEAFPDSIVSGHPKHRLASHLHIAFPGVDGERLVFGLESRGVYVSTGSACAAHKGTRSHVLMAIGMDESTANGSLRLTLGRHTTAKQIDQAVKAIIEVVNIEKERAK